MRTAALPTFIVALAASVAVAQPAQADSGTLVIADVAIRSDRVVMLACHVRGERAIAVGERGAVLVSEDGGVGWKSFRSRKTTRTLTSVVALDADVWIGVGHGGTMLRSEDGGRSARAIETEAGKDSFLGVIALDPTTLLAYGAFGLMLRSEDAGRTWKKQQVIDADFDRHVNRVIAAGDGLLLLVGESGTIALSHDRGVTWSRVESPYEGSFFGAGVTPGGAFLAFGMRGNVYRSTDRGSTWSKVDMPTKLPFFGAAILRDGRIVLTAAQGWLAVSGDDGRSFELRRVAAGDLAGAFDRDDGSLMIFGEQGIRAVQLAAQAN
ncbi:MAG: hypothetical protein IT518_03750 [Burkholderiales bacterium]|nr:hypothetical protein [Burkholderiales bacterium]